MQSSTHLEKLFTYPLVSFQQHLEFEANQRIIFSGKFGIGKSYFLDHFFKDDSQHDLFNKVKYRPFHIYPVHYAIASNEDIFRYIKYDVITTLLQKNISIEERDLKFIDKIPTFINAHPLKVLASIISMVPKIGKDFMGLYNSLKSLETEFKKFEKESTPNEGDILVAELELLEAKEGSIIENNLITRVIANILSRLKRESDQKNVLIIDDLDRIDPEHIFRLLNVFAAHMENAQGLPNKLGFDIVILVCDIQNIRNIFKAKYGANTDFNGYIDKFYSNEVFHLDNREVLKELSYKAFRNVFFLGIGDYEVPYYQQQIFNQSNLAVELLVLLIQNGQINLRTILNRMNSPITLANYPLHFDGNTETKQLKHNLLIHFKILKKFAGEYDDIKQMVMNIPLQNLMIDNLNDNCQELIYYLMATEHRFHKAKYASKFYLPSRMVYLFSEDADHDIKKNKIYESAYDEQRPETHNTVTFTKEEFLYLLSQFLDLLKRINN